MIYYVELIYWYVMMLNCFDAFKLAVSFQVLRNFEVFFVCCYSAKNGGGIVAILDFWIGGPGSHSAVGYDAVELHISFACIWFVLTYLRLSLGWANQSHQKFQSNFSIGLTAYSLFFPSIDTYLINIGDCKKGSTLYLTNASA